MFFDVIEALAKVFDVMIANPAQFTFIAATALCAVVVSALIIRRRYKRLVADLATTVVALYDLEHVALEILKEDNANVKTKTVLRSLAFEKGGFSTKKFRSQAMKYAKKD